MSVYLKNIDEIGDNQNYNPINTDDEILLLNLITGSTSNNIDYTQFPINQQQQGNESRYIIFFYMYTEYFNYLSPSLSLVLIGRVLRNVLYLFWTTIYYTTY